MDTLTVIPIYYPNEAVIGYYQKLNDKGLLKYRFKDGFSEDVVRQEFSNMYHFGAYIEKELVGILTLEQVGPNTYLSHFTIADDIAKVLKVKVGRVVMETIKDYFHKLGLKPLVMAVIENDNDAAIKFAKMTGYKEIGRFDLVYLDQWVGFLEL